MWQKSELEQRLWSIVEPVVAQSGRELVDLTFRRESHGWVLRLLVDEPGGIGVDACASLSREISCLLDVEDIIGRPYHLEVSSPGLERPLTRPEHFLRFAGQEVCVRTLRARAGCRQFRGRLLGIQDGRVRLATEGGALEFDKEEIERVNLVFRWHK